ncbi:hypothetical protein ACFXP3_02025 [Streptomyces sp. NPDC059096]
MVSWPRSPPEPFGPLHDTADRRRVLPEVEEKAMELGRAFSGR